MRDPKPSDNVLPHKPLDIHVLDVCQRFSFNPFGKVINAYQKPPFISYCFEERSHNVQAPLGKRPWARQEVKNAPGLMDVRSKSLALVTLLHVLLFLSLHIRSSISLSEGPVR